MCLEFPRQIFEKTQLPNTMNIHPVGAELFHTDGRTDGAKLMVAFRIAANEPKNSTFCPHSVFMCFVWIWELTAIISLYNINWLFTITETESVYCAVRNGSVSVTLVNLTLIYKHSKYM